MSVNSAHFNTYAAGLGRCSLDRRCLLDTCMTTRTQGLRINGWKRVARGKMLMSAHSHCTHTHTYTHICKPHFRVESALSRLTNCTSKSNATNDQQKCRFNIRMAVKWAPSRQCSCLVAKNNGLACLAWISESVWTWYHHKWADYCALMHLSGWRKEIFVFPSATHLPTKNHSNLIKTHAEKNKHSKMRIKSPIRHSHSIKCVEVGLSLY